MDLTVDSIVVLFGNYLYYYLKNLNNDLIDLSDLIAQSVMDLNYIYLCYYKLYINGV